MIGSIVLPTTALAAFDPATCVVSAIALNADPTQVEKSTDSVKFTYQAATDCANRNNMSFIVRASSNNFANDYYVARKVSIPSSAFVKNPGTNFYTANGSFSYAIFSNTTSTSLGIRGCIQNLNETPDCEPTGSVITVKQTPPPGSTPPGNTPPGTGGNANPATNYDTVIGNFENPLKANSIPELLVRLMRILLGLIAAVAVVVIIVSGFRMVFSQGNPVALTKAKAAITWAIIGLIVALMAFSIIAILQRLIETK